MSGATVADCDSGNAGTTTGIGVPQVTWTGAQGLPVPLTTAGCTMASSSHFVAALQLPWASR